MSSLDGSKTGFDSIATQDIPKPVPSRNAFDNALFTATAGIYAFGQKAKRAVNTAIAAVKDNTKEISHAVCEWAKLKVCQMWQWYRDNPKEAALILACIVIPIIVGTCWGPLLGAFGFTATGVVAGSIAAGIQAALGNVAAGSLFAILTSAAMGGYGVVIVSSIAWGVTSLVCSSLALAVWNVWRDKKKGEDGGEGDGYEMKDIKVV
ncbi:hypothetical protein BDV96DRAFT_646540 [Lophiotrema nucula]|uniref:Uncharacterized protein n=1 Tax=Lophiotrema nucula TaxID=690887 RepID=A0A6A5Z9W9_9PLEO|nr:hypothetical protein BDV96DRAFT_646540 [Lophiotrema nucula]